MKNLTSLIPKHFLPQVIKKQSNKRYIVIDSVPLYAFRHLKKGELIDRVGITGSYQAQDGWYKVSRMHGEYGKTSLPSKREKEIIDAYLTA